MLLYVQGLCSCTSDYSGTVIIIGRVNIDNCIRIQDASQRNVSQSMLCVINNVNISDII